MIKIYEVMAVEHNLPLFFLDHVKRFQSSISRYKDFSEPDLIQKIKDLITPIIKGTDQFNLKITYTVETDEFSILKSVPRKPSIELYDIGATVGLFDGERINPLVKRENNPLREVSDKICSEKGYYDLLLRNRDGNITEGSRSNFLLIDKDDNIITSPIGDALNGVTRSVIFKICKENGINIIEKNITTYVLESAVSLIITGTSPEILPILSCENKIFNVKHRIISILKTEFNLKKSIDNKKTRDIWLLP